MRRCLIPLSAAFTVAAGCGEEKVPEPNLPRVVSGEARCRDPQNSGVYRLEWVEVVVEDLDGAEDLGEPEMIVLASRLEPQATPEANAEGEEVRVVYRWDRQDDDEPIYCGDDGKALTIEFRVKDAEGFPAKADILSNPL